MSACVVSPTRGLLAQPRPGMMQHPIVCVGLCAVQNQTIDNTVRTVIIYDQAKKEDTLGSASTNVENRINNKNWLFQIVMNKCRSSAMNRYVTLYG